MKLQVNVLFVNINVEIAQELHSNVLILVPIMKVSISSYFWSIGLGYFVIPILGISMGLLLDKKTKQT